MKPTKIYQCEDTIEGILSAVYDAWASEYDNEFIKLEVSDNKQTFQELELFSQYITVLPDSIKAGKVARSIQSKISDKVYQMVLRAAACSDVEKANSIYHFLVLGFAVGGQVVQQVTDSYVRKIFAMDRYIGNEVHLFLGFLRFTELENGILFAKYNPKGNITIFLAPHFAERLKNEDFIIVDCSRKLAAVHQKGFPWAMTTLTEGQIDFMMKEEGNENKYQNLWKTFFDSIAIETRKNYKLQRSNTALHYRKYMTEFMEMPNSKANRAENKSILTDAERSL